MVLFAFDFGQDWSSTEVGLWLYITIPLFLVYVAIFGGLALLSSRRKKRRDNRKSK